MGWGLCKFCGEQKLLIKAHIIPEWMYEPLYDEKHKIFSFSSSGNPKKIKRPSSGEYEKNLLCSICDNKMGAFEQYGSLIFKGGGNKPISIKTENGDRVAIHHISGLNYKLFKLFLLSLLWKASISSRETYKNLKISSDEEERIKEMISSEDPGGKDSFPVSIFALHSLQDKTLQQLILAPYSNAGLHIFYIAGYLFVFADSVDKIANETFCLSTDGTISIPAFTPVEAYDLLKKMYGLDWLSPEN
jgi:hypothetical protein